MIIEPWQWLSVGAIVLFLIFVFHSKKEAEKEGKLKTATILSFLEK